MNIKTIMEAMSALEQAGRALRCGGADVTEQMRLGRNCDEAQISLQLALERDFPEVKIDRHSGDLLQRETCKAALEKINTMACYASEEDTEARENVLLMIGETARLALTATTEPEKEA